MANLTYDKQLYFGAYGAGDGYFANTINFNEAPPGRMTVDVFKLAGITGGTVTVYGKQTAAGAETIIGQRVFTADDMDEDQIIRTAVSPSRFPVLRVKLSAVSGSATDTPEAYLNTGVGK